VGQQARLAQLRLHQETETYKWLGNVPKFREWVGGRAAGKPKVETYSIRNKLWEQTLEFGIDDLRRDKTGQIMIRIGELAQAGAAFWEDLLTSLINNGNTSGFTAYDGELYFDTDHPVKEIDAGSTTAKNLVTATEVPALDVTTATAPTVVEAANILLGLVGHFHTFTNDQGHLLNAQARDFTVMVARRRCGVRSRPRSAQAFLTSGQSNPITGLKSKGYNFDVILNPNLTSATDKVYIFRTDAKLKPFILQEETEPKVTVIGAGSEEEFKNRRHLFGTERIANAGYGLWQYAVKATLS
jgi:phage major head subunit gpT-like protein